MITHVELKGWRAYDHVALRLEPGTTFIVARNGIGKTSLLQGVAFALYGARSGFDTPASIRKGFDTAVATVSVLLPDGRTALISRTVTPKDTELDASVEGVALGESEVDVLLSEAFGADVADLARLTFLPAGSLQDFDVEKFHLRRHLCYLFGIDQLEALLPEIKRLDVSARSDVRKLRDVKRSSDAELAQWVSDLAVAEEQLEEARAHSRGLREQLTGASDVIKLADEAERVAQLHLARERELQTIRNRLAAIIETEISPDSDLRALVLDSERAAGSRAADIERQRGRLEGHVELIDASEHQLDEAGADCPVCRRPLDESDRERAKRQHQMDMERFHAEIAILSAEAERLEMHRAALATLRGTLWELPNLPPASTAPAEENVRVAREAVETLQARIESSDEQSAMLRAQITTLRSQIDTAEQNQQYHALAVTAYRREVLADAAHAAVVEMTERLIADKIDPIAEMVAARFKTVFRGSRPSLRLDASGDLRLVRQGSEIEFKDMSAGERAVALLVTRLIVLSVTAPAAFMWLDEPLEQLDPINRRLMARLLGSSSHGPIRQLVVTTFEEKIARLLEKRSAGVRVEYVTAAD